MLDIVQYVAGASEFEAKSRFEAGLAKATQREAERDAELRNERERCEPKCHNIVYRVRTTIEPM